MILFKKASIYALLFIVLLAPCIGLSRTEGYFNVKGKFSAISAVGSAVLNFTWVQDQDDYKILINHFLGSFSARIEGNQSFVTLWLSNQKEPIYSTRPNELIQKYFGFTLPILSMKHWIRGEANPSMPWSFEGERNRRQYSIEQSNWSIKYLVYMKNLPSDIGLDLVPKKFTIQSENTKIKMFIKYWNLTAPVN